jgi:hypothetical protein
MTKYKGLDLVDTDSLLTIEEKKICEKVRQWVTQEVLPIIEEQYQKSTFPKNLILIFKL